MKRTTTCSTRRRGRMGWRLVCPEEQGRLVAATARHVELRNWAKRLRREDGPLLLVQAWCSSPLQRLRATLHPPLARGALTPFSLLSAPRTGTCSCTRLGSVRGTWKLPFLGS